MTVLYCVVQGSPGIGKTTCVLALAREMLGDSTKEGVLELNASDERCSCALITHSSVLMLAVSLLHAMWILLQVLSSHDVLWILLF